MHKDKMPGDGVDHDVIVIGAGFAGLYALYLLRELGFSVRVLERGEGVGGTWYWNRYPGARCDIESLEYSYSFSPELEQEWEWTERYPAQPEILRYINHVADRFDLRKDISLRTEVVSVKLDESGEELAWEVETDDGEVLRARFVVTAAGCLSANNVPPFAGLDRFQGIWHHTANWPEEGVELAGKRVGVIGTGATGIQLIPEVAAAAEHLFVFQRTPNFSIPAQNRPLEPEVQSAMKERYREHRQKARESSFGVPVFENPASALEATPEERQRAFDAAWQAGGGSAMLLSFADLMVDEQANEFSAEYVRGKIREKVEDPGLADLLAPTDHPIGSKRICLDTDYFETYNRDNVTLISVRDNPIETITPTGVALADGTEVELDVLLFATGFDGITGPLLNLNIEGRDGLRLRDKWEHGPSTYLGLATTGFPNMLFITGPQSPSVISNVVVSIEQHVEFIADLLEHMREQGIEQIEPDQAAEDAWSEHVLDVASATLFSKANSWWLGANIPGKPRVFAAYAGGVNGYRRKCDEVAAQGYEGFELVPAPADRESVAAGSGGAGEGDG